MIQKIARIEVVVERSPQDNPNNFLRKWSKKFFDGCTASYDRLRMIRIFCFESEFKFAADII